VELTEINIDKIVLKFLTTMDRFLGLLPQQDFFFQTLRLQSIRRISSRAITGKVKHQLKKIIIIWRAAFIQKCISVERITKRNYCQPMKIRENWNSRLLNIHMRDSCLFGKSCLNCSLIIIVLEI